MKLCIAIPTYNRPEQLRNTVKRLLPQLTAKVYILICDNHSTIPAETVLEDVITEAGCRIVIHRNQVNIGMCPNIVRLFELAEAQWIWTLGDDDGPLEDSVSHLLSLIDDLSNDVCYVCCGVKTTSNDALTYDGIIKEMLHEETLYDVVCLSKGLYRKEALADQLQRGYYTCNSYIPYVLMMLQCLRSGSHARFSVTPIVNYHHAETGTSWPYENVMMGLCSLLEIDEFQSPHYRKFVANAVVVYRYRPFISESLKRLFVDNTASRTYWVVFFGKLSKSIYGVRKLQVLMFYGIAIVMRFLFPREKLNLLENKRN